MGTVPTLLSVCQAVVGPIGLLPANTELACLVGAVTRKGSFKWLWWCHCDEREGEDQKNVEEVRKNWRVKENVSLWSGK